MQPAPQPPDSLQNCTTPKCSQVVQSLAQGFEERGRSLVLACLLSSFVVTVLLCSMMRFEPEYMFISPPFFLSFGLTLYFLAICRFQVPLPYNIHSYSYVRLQVARLPHWVASLPVFTDTSIAYSGKSRHNPADTSLT